MLPVLIAMTISSQLETTLFIGTYTDPNGSKGIYRVRLNPETGALSAAELAAETTAPSYLCLGHRGKVLYAVNEYTGGEVSAFAVENGALRKLNTAKFDGGGPCHVSVTPDDRNLLVAAYGGGTLTSLPLMADGSIAEPSTTFKNEGSGPNKKRQEHPHMHFAGMVGEFVYACDLGTDEVLTFKLQDGKLIPFRSGRTNPGAGPRHFVVSPDGKNLYANNEMGMGVSVFDRNPANGLLHLVQTETTIPDCDPDAGYSTAAIRLHPNLPVLYVSNRGHNSVSIFEVKASGRVERKGIFQLDVKNPRDINIDPSGKWMAVAAQDSSELITLRIDPTNGLLSQTNHRSKVAKPVCVVFAS